MIASELSVPVLVLLKSSAGLDSWLEGHSLD